MRPLHDFAPARRAAQHCPELLAGTFAAAAEDEPDAGAQLAEALTDSLPELLAPVLGKRIRVIADEAETQKASWLMRKIGRTSASYAVKLGTGPGLLVSFDLATAHRLTDRLFGGAGLAGAEEPDVLPLSASMALERIVIAVAAAISPAGETEITRGSDVAKLAPFSRKEDCLCWTMTIQQDGHEDWSFRFAAPLAAIADLCMEPSDAADPVPRSLTETAREQAFAALPLPLTAVLAETRLPLARLAELRPGDLIPLPFQREVPLRIGRDTIAHGSLGTLDDRIALQLTRIA
jgi:flagellar motor switch/type III secretory pathway protein FliN